MMGSTLIRLLLQGYKRVASRAKEIASGRKGAFPAEVSRARAEVACCLRSYPWIRAWHLIVCAPGPLDDDAHISIKSEVVEVLSRLTRQQNTHINIHIYTAAIEGSKEWAICVFPHDPGHPLQRDESLAGGDDQHEHDLSMDTPPMAGEPLGGGRPARPRLVGWL